MRFIKGTCLFYTVFSIMENYDSGTLWAFKMQDLRQIILANNIPKISTKGGKRALVEDILMFQGNYQAEMQKIKNCRDQKNNAEKAKRLDLVANVKRDEKSLKKLNITQLMDMIYELRVERDDYEKFLTLKGAEKKKALISVLVCEPANSSANRVSGTEKYEKYYVYPGHWFREEYEIIKPVPSYSTFNISNVLCVLCYKTTGVFKKQFNVCKDCHKILQHEFCRRYLWLYKLTTDILEHRDVRCYMWNILKHVL